MNYPKYQDGILPKSLYQIYPGTIKYSHFIHKDFSTRKILGIETRVDVNGFICITDICRKKCKDVNGFFRNKTIQDIFKKLQDKKDYPVIYTNKYTEHLRGTFVSPEIFPYFEKWINRTL